MSGWIETLGGDAMHALRHMVRRRSFTVVNGATLGLALGASVLAFAVLYGYLFRPLPYVQPRQLLVPRQRLVKAGLLGPQVSVRFYRTLKRQSAFHEAGLVDLTNGTTVTVASQHDCVHFVKVTASTFALLGVKPLLGRTLSAASDRQDGSREVVLSYAFWQRAFGGKSSALGAIVQVRGTPMQVVGVMPRGFVFPIPHTAFWAPLVMTPRRERSGNVNYLMLTRMPAGWSLPRVNAFLRALRERELRSESPAARVRAKRNGYVIDAVPYREVLLSFAGGSAPIWGLFGFALLLLSLTTLNSANLALPHQRERLGDLTLRQVLGAGRAAIVRVTLLEYLPILLIMAVIAATVAAYCIALLHTYQLPSPYMPFVIRFGPATALYLIVAAALVFVCLAGSAVAASLQRCPSVSGLQELAARGSASRALRTMQRVMAAAQIAIALVLIICGTLLSQSLIGLLSQRLHFNRRHLIVATVVLPKAIGIKQFWRQGRTRLRRLPATESVALSHMVPFGESSVGGLFYPRGELGKRTWAWMPPVSSAFFKTMGIHLVAGRPFERSDGHSGARDVIVSVALARAFYGRTDVVGEMLDRDRRIIGVAPSLPWKLDPGSDHHRYAVYVPIAASGGHYMHILIRSGAAPAVVIPALRRAVAAVAPGAAIYHVHTLAQIMRQSSLDRMAFTSLVAGLGGLAFLIAVFGVYTIVAYGTRLRMFEFAVRRVLGSSREAILSLALRETAMLLLAGGAFGIAITVVIAQGLRSLLYGVAVLEPGAYLMSLMLIGAAVLAATALPVWRAMRFNPAEIMRE